jgi:hypothetical protein
MGTNHQILKFDENGDISTVDYMTDIKNPIDASFATHMNVQSKNVMAAGYGYIRYCGAIDEYNPSANAGMSRGESVRIPDGQFIRCLNWAAKGHGNRPFDHDAGNCTVANMHATPQTGCWWVHTTHLLGNNL